MRNGLSCRSWTAVLACAGLLSLLAPAASADFVDFSGSVNFNNLTGEIDPDLGLGVVRMTGSGSLSTASDSGHFDGLGSVSTPYGMLNGPGFGTGTGTFLFDVDKNYTAFSLALSADPFSDASFTGVTFTAKAFDTSSSTVAIDTKNVTITKTSGNIEGEFVAFNSILPLTKVEITWSNLNDPAAEAHLLFDNLTVVPEPRSLLLLVMGGLAVLARSRRKV